MTKSGFHISAGDRQGLKQCLVDCWNAGSPVAVIFSLGEDIWPDIRSTYPASIPDDQLPTTYIFRTQKDKDGIVINDGPADMYTGNPEQSATDFMARIMPVWYNNKAHYYAPLNEQDGGPLQDMTWLNRWLVKAMTIAEQNGFRLAIPACSVGNPRDGETSLDPYSLEDRWHELLPAMRQAKAKGHVLIVHEYGLDRPAANGGSACSLRASAPHLALRHRRSMSYLLANDALPDKTYITEASAAVGFKPAIAGGGLTKQQWLDDAKWYDLELQKFDAVGGCCWYQYGGKENLKEIVPQLSLQMQQLQPYDTGEKPYAQGAESMFGLHGRSGSDHCEADWQALRLARPTVGWYKLVTNTNVEEINRVVMEGIIPAQIIMRLYFDTHNRPGKISAAEFVEWQMIHLTRFNALGGKYVEVHNEPNHPDENNGQWSGPNEFSAWFNQVRAIIKQRFPNLLVGMPGLWPNDNVASWLTGCASAYQMCDWVGVHCYFTNDAQMTQPEHGAYWNRFIQFNKTMIITEFSNPTDVDKTIKANQYLKYVAGLTHPKLKAALCYIVSTPGFANEAWVAEDGTISVIPGIVGKGTITPPQPPPTLPNYKRVYVAIPGSLPDYISYADIATARKITVGPSLDDALIGDHLTDRTAIVVKPTVWNMSGAPALLAYRDQFAEYRGTKMQFVDPSTPQEFLQWLIANGY